MTEQAAVSKKTDIEVVDDVLNPTFEVAGKQYAMPKIKARKAINYMRRAAKLGKQELSDADRMIEFANILDDFMEDCGIPEMDDLPLSDVMRAFNSFFAQFARQMGGEAERVEAASETQKESNGESSTRN